MPRINQLTPKMEKFCEGIVSGLPYFEAYKAAYNTKNMNPTTIRREALRLTKRNDITQRIKEMRTPLLNHHENVVISESERIKGHLWDIIHDPEEKTENQIRAMDILNRMNKAYNDNTTEEDTQNKLTNIDTNKLMELIRVN